jgi:proline racemase
LNYPAGILARPQKEDAMLARHVIHTIDSHTGGEPTRLVTSGIPVRGDSLLAQREHLRQHHDRLRSALMCEPRGHRGMFGAVICPPTRTEVDFGIVWLDHNGSYLNMCGHGTIGIGVSAVECGLVEVSEPETRIAVDMPAGPVEIIVPTRDGRAHGAAFRNVPAFCECLDVPVDVPEWGTLKVDIAFGGSFFAAVKASDLGLEVVPGQVPRLVDAGLAIRKALNAQTSVAHPVLEHIRSVDLVTIYGPSATPGVKYRNIHVFADGSFDRSPGGTGTSHMMAMLIARGEMAADETIVSESLTGAQFRGRMVEAVKLGDRDGFVPEIAGEAYITGFHQFVISPEDPLAAGFTLD